MTIKNITKKLVDAGYSEEKLILMTEKEIRTAYKNYKSSPKEDDSILSFPNTTPENNDNTMDKEETTMTNEMIKVTVKVEGLNEVLTRYGIELICSNPSDADTIAIGQTPSQRRKGIAAVIITQTPSQYRKGIATMTIREDVYKTIEKDLSIVSNNSTTSVEKEESTMKTRTTQELINDALNISKIQDENYVTNAMLREEYKKLTGNVIGSKKTRPVIIKAIQDAIGEIKVICENRLDDAGNINTTEKRFANAVEAEKYALEAAEYNSVISVRIVDGENISIVKPESVSVGDLSITSDRICHDDTIIEKAVPVAKVNNPVPDDAKVLTYKLMHMIGDHALTNRKKGFGTTISAKMLCAFIVEVASSNDPEPIDRLYVPTGKKDKYGKPITMVNPKITEEHKNKCKDVRKWLIDNHYIETVTFKDEKGFVFYTPEYDGNRKDKMYDATKFQSTGKTETTTYRVTKEMNKWYTK